MLVSSTSASPVNPWGVADSVAWEVASTKLAPWKLSAASRSHRQSLWQMKQFGLSSPCSLLPSCHRRASDAQAAPKPIQGVRSHTQSRDPEDFSSCHPRPRDLPDKVPAEGRTSVRCCRLRGRVWRCFSQHPADLPSLRCSHPGAIEC